MSRVTAWEQKLNDIKELKPKHRQRMCWCCYSYIRDEPMWRKWHHASHGSFTQTYCQTCFPVKELLAKYIH